MTVINNDDVCYTIARLFEMTKNQSREITLSIEGYTLIQMYQTIVRTFHWEKLIERCADSTRHGCVV